MDHLEQGIGLRAMGQRDPLTEWQREGYDMFGQLVHTIAQDFVRNIMHVTVVREQAPQEVTNVQYQAADDPTEKAATPAIASMGVVGEEEAAAAAEPEPAAAQPVVKSDWDKTPRNAPCPCGSGKKFKACHGA
jgi:preprotein translocase subunit SecA